MTCCLRAFCAERVKNNPSDSGRTPAFSQILQKVYRLISWEVVHSACRIHSDKKNTFYNPVNPMIFPCHNTNPLPNLFCSTIFTLCNRANSRTNRLRAVFSQTYSACAWQRLMLCEVLYRIGLTLVCSTALMLLLRYDIFSKTVP